MIRPMRRSDLAQVLSWRNRPEVRRHMLTQHVITLEEHTRWFERARRDPSRRLLVIEGEHGPIGWVQFTHVAAGGVCDWGFYTTAEAPAGSGLELGQAALAFAFEQLAVHKVFGQALAGNEASIRLHRKLDFREEGVLRRHQRIGDAYHDLLCFGLLREEWQTADRRPRA